MRKFLLPVALVVMALVVTGCLGGGGKPDQQITIHVSADRKTVEVGQTVTLTANVNGTGASNAQIQWASGEGSLSTKTGTQVVWTAPSVAGDYDIVATATVGGRSVTGKVQIQVVQADGGGNNGGGGDGQATINVGSFFRPGAKWVYEMHMPDPDSDLDTLTLTKTVEVRQEGPSLILHKTLTFTDGSVNGRRITASGKEHIEIELDRLLVHKAEVQAQGRDGFAMAHRTVYGPPPGQILTAYEKGRKFSAQWQETRMYQMFGIEITYVVDVSLEMEILDIVPESVITAAGHFPNALRVNYWIKKVESDEDGTEVTQGEITEWYDPVVGLIITVESLDEYGMEDEWEEEIALKLKSYTVP